MKSFRSILAVLGLAIAVTGCTNPTVTKENLLSASDFKTMPLTTPAQVAWFKSLPPHKLAQKTYKGGTVWVYADPTICGCLYVGNQDAYKVYVKAAAHAGNTARLEQLNAQDAMNSMDDLGLP